MQWAIIGPSRPPLEAEQHDMQLLACVFRSKPFFSAYSDGNVVIHFSFTASETNPQLGAMHRLREALEASGFLTSEHAKTLKHPTITSRELSGRVDELLNVFEMALR